MTRNLYSCKNSLVVWKQFQFKIELKRGLRKLAFKRTVESSAKTSAKQEETIKTVNEKVDLLKDYSSKLSTVALLAIQNDPNLLKSSDVF